MPYNWNGGSSSDRPSVWGTKNSHVSQCVWRLGQSYYVDCIMWRLRPSDRQKQATTSHRLCPGASLDQCSCEFHIFIQYIRSLLSFSLVPTPVVANPLILLVDLIPTCAGIVQCKWGYPWSDGNSAPHASTVPHSASVPTMNLDSSGRTCWRAHRHHVLCTCSRSCHQRWQAPTSPFVNRTDSHLKFSDKMYITHTLAAKAIL
jgi:hypothetical protein